MGESLAPHGLTRYTSTMEDGYRVEPEVLRSVAIILRARGDANGNAATYGLDAPVDAGRSSGELAAAAVWLAEELAKATTSLTTLADNLDGAADRYDATEAGSASTYGDARQPVGSPVSTTT